MNISGNHFECTQCNRKFKTVVEVDKHRTGRYGNYTCMTDEQLRQQGMWLDGDCWRFGIKAVKG